MNDLLRAKELRMRAVYEREKRLREAASVVVLHGETAPKKLDGVYVESATAARLRGTYERTEASTSH